MFFLKVYRENTKLFIEQYYNNNNNIVDFELCFMYVY